MRWPVAAAALLLLAAPASASLLYDTTAALVGGTPVEPFHYQVDAGTEHDAPDTCEGALASPLPFELPVGGQVQGLLLPIEDELDHYRVPIGQELVGGRVTVSVLGHEASLPVAMDVVMPLCGSSVTAAENQPLPPPSHPEPAAGEKQVTPHNLDQAPSGCSTRWFFVLNQFGGRAAPATIHAVWTDGSEEDIPLLKDTPATLAQYATSEHLAYTLDSVTANVPADWTGQFNLAEAPCGTVDGEAVFGAPSVSGNNTIEFTPVAAGVYVLSVRALPPEAGAPGLETGPQTMSCHAACAALSSPLTSESGYSGFAF